MMTRSCAFFLALYGASCGDGDGQSPADGGAMGDAPPSSQRFLPLRVGASWTYTVTPVTAPAEDKTTTVEALEDVGGLKSGVRAYRVRTEKPDGVTVSWQEDRGITVVRHREQSFTSSAALVSDEFYQPHKLRLDEDAEHTAAGASWMETYQEVEIDPITGAQTTLTKVETWTVDAASEPCQVSGTELSCLRVRRTGQDLGQAAKTYWFARGVGKIKEVGANQTEELKAYQVP